jgi:glycerophosphoryl diester phosphodiesterase
MLIIGHRGVPSLAPENTLGGFRRVAELGVTWVEFDVTLLGDGTPIVIHDDSLDRCSDQTGMLAELSIAQLEGVNNAALYPEWPREPVPLLDDVVSLLMSLNMGFNLEIKPYDLPHDQVLRQISRVLEKYVDLQEQLIISCFDMALLKRCRQLLPQYKIGLLFDELPHDWQRVAQEIGAFSIHLDWKNMSANQVQAIHAAGYRVYCWTLNDPQYQREFEAWGVDGVMSDYPQLFTN